MWWKLPEASSEAKSVRSFQIGEDSGVEYDQRCILGRLLRQCSKVCPQVTMDDERPMLFHNRQSSMEICETIHLVWPHQCFEPCNLILIVHINGVQVEANTPDDHRHLAICSRDRLTIAACSGVKQPWLSTGGFVGRPLVYLHHDDADCFSLIGAETPWMASALGSAPMSEGRVGLDCSPGGRRHITFAASRHLVSSKP